MHSLGNLSSLLYSMLIEKECRLGRFPAISCLVTFRLTISSTLWSYCTCSRFLFCIAVTHMKEALKVLSHALVKRLSDSADYLVSIIECYLGTNGSTRVIP
jgi:hypothetical protein